MSDLKIAYRKNPAYTGNGTGPRFFATIDLRPYGVKGEMIEVTELPVFFKRLEKPIGPVRDVYSVYPAGLPVERGNLHALQSILDGYLKVLIRFDQLPEYVFRVGSTAWPIYKLGDELVTHYPGGPVFRAFTIQDLRKWLANHFKGTGRVENAGDLEVFSLSPADLQLYPVAL